MTVAYALSLKRRLKCKTCSDKALAERRFCSRHLEYARQTWRKHVRSCAASGRCINCQNRKLRGEQRCGWCKQHNRDRLKSWWAGPGGQRRRAKVRAAISIGMCDSCIKRRAVPGHRKCAVCYPKGYQS